MGKTVWTLPRRAVEKAQWTVEKRRLARAEQQRAQELAKAEKRRAQELARAEKQQAQELLRRRRDLYSQFMKRGELVFDVGANVGNRVEVFLSLRARVVAVEPLPDCARYLRETFGRRCVVVEKGLAASNGTVALRRGGMDVLSTMSDSFIEATRASGRFRDQIWEPPFTVGVTTLDALIAEHGVPRFTKIDVEGYEPQVLAGLSSPLPALSYEYTHEIADNAADCIARLESLGSYTYSFSFGETMELGPWMGPDEILPWIAGRTDDPFDWGDIYARRTELTPRG